MIGRIEATRKSGSGKSLGVKVGNTWYTTTTFELEHEVGKTIIFEPSHSPANGNFSAMNWLNDYVFEDQQTTPAGQAMDQAMQQQAATPVGQAGQYEQVPRGTPNKDSMIGAFALCKCCTPGTPDQVFENFQLLYHKLENWDSSIPF